MFGSVANFLDPLFPQTGNQERGEQPTLWSASSEKVNDVTSTCSGDPRPKTEDLASKTSTRSAAFEASCGRPRWNV